MPSSCWSLVVLEGRMESCKSLSASFTHYQMGEAQRAEREVINLAQHRKAPGEEALWKERCKPGQDCNAFLPQCRTHLRSEGTFVLSHGLIWAFYLGSSLSPHHKAHHLYNQ